MNRLRRCFENLLPVRFAGHDESMTVVAHHQQHKTEHSISSPAITSADRQFALFVAFIIPHQGCVNPHQKVLRQWQLFHQLGNHTKHTDLTSITSIVVPNDPSTIDPS